MNLKNPRLLVFTATYNEKENIPILMKAIWDTVPYADIMVTDDNSPDGTGKLLDQMQKDLSAEHSKLILNHRPGKMGVGSAHKEALTFALEKKYDLLITMDADLSHDPAIIATMVKELETHDFVIGSRFAKGGKLDYHGFRRVISVGANLIARYLLGIKCSETTTSFRGFHSSLLKKFPIHKIEAEGYSFFLECTFHICRTAENILEIPIYFRDRKFGYSKISKNEIFKGFLTVIRLFFTRMKM